MQWYVEIFAFSRLGISVSRRSFGDLSNYKIEGEKGKNVGPTNQPILPPTQRFIYQVGITKNSTILRMYPIFESGVFMFSWAQENMKKLSFSKV